MLHRVQAPETPSEPAAPSPQPPAVEDGSNGGGATAAPAAPSRSVFSTIGTSHPHLRCKQAFLSCLSFDHDRLSPQITQTLNGSFRSALHRDAHLSRCHDSHVHRRPSPNHPAPARCHVLVLVAPNLEERDQGQQEIAQLEVCRRHEHCQVGYADV